jgi:hypothetical protein
LGRGYNFCMKIFQYSCRESNKIDNRQSEAVLRNKPDVIFFEAPFDNKDVEFFNKFSVNKKPFRKVKEYQKMLLKVSKKYKWVKSDILVFDNIVKLWKSGHDVKLYNVDGPSDLLEITINNGWNKLDKPRRRGIHFSWWVYIYLRERIMSDNISKIIKKFPDDAVVLVFLQKFHWMNVKYQLQHKNKKDIFKYYFGKFKGVSIFNINKKVQESCPKDLIKFWDKYSKLI